MISLSLKGFNFALMFPYLIPYDVNCIIIHKLKHVSISSKMTFHHVNVFIMSDTNVPSREKNLISSPPTTSVYFTRW